jgi:basic membrane lipoprotein Med (substrate-binding protein (PBP1-ABC) superfamily)
MHDAAEALKEEDPGFSYEEAYKAFDPAAAVPVIRQYLDGGIDAVAMHSFFLEESARTLAKQYEDVPMQVPSFSGPQKPNLSSSLVSYLEVGYAACWLQGKISKSGKIGFVGAEPAPYATEILEGCKIGAKAAGAEVLNAWSDSFTDQQATLEQGKALLDKGADTLFPASATQDSLGGFKLCEQEKVPCVGWAADARRYAPNTAVTSVVINWVDSLKLLVEDARGGTVRAENFNGTFGNDGLQTPEFEGAPGDLVPADVQKEFEEIKAGLADESIELPESKAHPGFR